MHTLAEHTEKNVQTDRWIFKNICRARLKLKIPKKNNRDRDFRWHVSTGSRSKLNWKDLCRAQRRRRRRSRAATAPAQRRTVATATTLQHTHTCAEITAKQKPQSKASHQKIKQKQSPQSKPKFSQSFEIIVGFFNALGWACGRLGACGGVSGVVTEMKAGGGGAAEVLSQNVVVAVWEVWVVKRETNSASFPAKNRVENY